MNTTEAMCKLKQAVSVKFKFNEEIKKIESELNELNIPFEFSLAIEPEIILRWGLCKTSSKSRLQLIKINIDGDDSRPLIEWDSQTRYLYHKYLPKFLCELDKAIDSWDFKQKSIHTSN